MLWLGSFRSEYSSFNYCDTALIRFVTCRIMGFGACWVCCIMKVRSLLCLSHYGICCIMWIVAFLVCCLMWIVAYWICCLMTYEDGRLLDLLPYEDCRLLGLLPYEDCRL